MPWMKPQAERLELPSGNTAECKRPDIMGLVMHNAGNVPDFLTGKLTQRLTGKGAPTPDTDGGIKAEDWPKLASFIDLVIKAALVNPRVVDADPDYDAEIARVLIDDISSDDRLFVFGWAMPSEESATADSFRGTGATDGHLQFTHDGAGVRRQTVRDVRADE